MRSFFPSRYLGVPVAQVNAEVVSEEEGGAGGAGGALSRYNFQY